MAARVSATFESERDAERAVEAVVATGLDADAVTLVSPAGPEVGGAPSEEAALSDEERREEGVAVGALLGLGAVNAGAGLGGAGGASSGALLAAGGGGVAAGVIAGSLLGVAHEGLVDLGLDEATARLYGRRLRAGSSVVVVDPEEIDPNEARDILADCGGADLRGGEPFIPLV